MSDQTPQEDLAADKRPRSPGPASPRGELRKKRVRSDLSFALDNPLFADCKLTICGDRVCSADGSPSHLKEVAVSSAVMAANSAYFERMLAGSFLEGATRHIKIHVAEEDVAPFLHMLDFMYSGTLPQQVSSSFDKTLKVLLLADRFEADDCLSACASALDTFSPELKTSQAISLLSLPDHIKQEPTMLTVVEQGRICIVKLCTPWLWSPDTSKFCSLPEAGFIALLNSQDLPIEHEETLLEMADAWINENYKDSPEANLNAFCRLALPSIRASSLSPKSLECLFNRIRPALTGSSASASALTAPRKYSGAASPLEERDGNASSAGGVSPEEGGQCSLREAIDQTTSRDGCSLRQGMLQGREEVSPVRDIVLTWLLDSLLEFSELALVEFGSSISGCMKFKSCLRDGAPAKAPKAHHKLPPQLKIYLDIPLRHLEDPNWSGAIEAQPAIIGGNWVRLSIRRSSQSDSLIGALTWDTDGVLASELSSTEFELGMNLSFKSSDSTPAYEPVSDDLEWPHYTHTFEESSPTKRIKPGFNIGGILEDEEFFCPEGALRLRMDLWTVQNSKPYNAWF